MKEVAANDASDSGFVTFRTIGTSVLGADSRTPDMDDTADNDERLNINALINNIMPLKNRGGASSPSAILRPCGAS